MVVKLGSVVEDHSGKFAGIVLEGSKEYAGQVYVRYWDDTFNLYVHYLMHKNLLRPSLDPGKVNRINRKDPIFQHVLRTDLAELALATNDEKWFNELMKGGKENEIEDI